LQPDGLVRLSIEWHTQQTEAPRRWLRDAECEE